MADRLDVQVRVNCDLRIIASGSREQIRAEADRVIRLIGDRPNATIGTGSLPYEADPDNVLYVTEYVTGAERNGVESATVYKE